MKTHHHARMYKLSSITIGSISLLVLIAISSLPSIRLFQPQGTHILMDRGNCSSPTLISPYFYELCPTFLPINQSLVHVTDGLGQDSANTVNSLDMARSMMLYVEQIQELKPVLLFMQFNQFPFLRKLLSESRCLDKFMDTMCEMSFERCTFDDCSTQSRCALYAQVQQFIDCGKQFCLLNDDCTVAVAFSTQRIQLFLDRFYSRVQGGFESLPDTTRQMVRKIHATIVKFGNTTAFEISLDNECDNWKEKITLTTIIDHNSNNNTVGCNPNVTTVTSVGSEPIVDCTIVLCVVYFLLFFVVAYFSSPSAGNSGRGRKDTNRPTSTAALNVNLTRIRVASFSIAMSTSVLVFIGATQLQAVLQLHNETAQTVWCWIYFFISFGGFQFGCLVLTSTTVHNDQIRTRTSSAVDGCCASGQKLLVWIQIEFIHSDGKYFPIKLVLAETFELILQINSLLSSAKSSDAELVLISALVISLNLIALPISLLLSLRFVRSPHLVIAITLSTEIFFDKIFTLVAVLFRADTIIEPNLLIFDQLVRHGGCLLPALMTALDIQDALSLAAHVEHQNLRRKHANVLVKSIYFSNLDPESIFIMVDTMNFLVVDDKNVDICRQGDAADIFYIIVSGKCNVTIDGTLITVLNEFDVFGEQALLHEDDVSTRGATVTSASSPLHLLALPKIKFDHLIASGTLNEECLKTLKRETEKRIKRNEGNRKQGTLKQSTEKKKTTTTGHRPHFFSAVSIVSGIVLGIFSLYSYTKQNQMCHDRIGHVAACARPRLYYKNGFFSATECAFENIKTLECRQNIMQETPLLPDAVEWYRSMTKLSSIDVSHNPHLQNAPTGWGHLTNPLLKIVLINNPSLKQFPFAICTNRAVNEIVLEGTYAREHLDWSNQINGTVSANIYMSKACQHELFPYLKSISLANNSLRCSRNQKEDQCALIRMRLKDFQVLRHIDLNYNNFTGINKFVVDQTAKTAAAVGGRISFTGNRIDNFRVVGQPREISLAFLNYIIDTSVLKVVDLSASLLTWKDIKTSKLNEPMPLLEELSLTGLHWRVLNGWIRNRASLVKLRINFMYLEDLGSELHGLTKLQYLEMEGNYFNSVGLKDSLRDLIETTTLDFEEGRLNSLPSHLFPKLQYEVLDFHLNKITAIDVDVFKDMSVTKLVLSNNKLTELDVEIFRRMDMDLERQSIDWEFQENPLTNAAIQKVLDYFVREKGFVNTRNKTLKSSGSSVMLLNRSTSGGESVGYSSGICLDNFR